MERGLAEYKWRLAVGTTSRVPNSKGNHYMILDIDSRKIYPELFSYLKKIGATQIFMQGTDRGWHIYTNLILPWNRLLQLMPTRIDEAWVTIGKSRGYFFLADKDAVILPWPVERMEIHAKERQESNTR